MEVKIRKIKEGVLNNILVVFDDNRLLSIPNEVIDTEYLMNDGEKEMDQIVRDYAIANYESSQLPMNPLDPNRISDIEVDGVDDNDYPDFADAYASSATYTEPDGFVRECTDEELDWITDNLGDTIHEIALENF